MNKQKMGTAYTVVLTFMQRWERNPQYHLQYHFSRPVFATSPWRVLWGVSSFTATITSMQILNCVASLQPSTGLGTTSYILFNKTLRLMIYLFIDLLFIGRLLARILDFYQERVATAVIRRIILNNICIHTWFN